MTEEKIETNNEEPKEVKGTIETPKPENGEEPKDINPNAPIIPDGFDEEIFDTETMSLKADKVKERLAKEKEEAAKWQKQAQDMRRKLSKGIETPEKVEEYATQYVPPEEFVPFVEDKETPEAQFIDATFKNIDKMAHDNQLTITQTKEIKDMAFGLLKDLQVLKSPEDKEKSNAELNKKMKESLGDDFKQVQKENQEFLTNYGVFDNNEKKMLIEASKTNPVVNTLVVKIRQLFDQTGTKIPVKAAVDNLSSDTDLWLEYTKNETTDDRRTEIIKQRIAAGRNGKFGS